MVLFSCDSRRDVPVLPFLFLFSFSTGYQSLRFLQGCFRRFGYFLGILLLIAIQLPTSPRPWVQGEREGDRPTLLFRGAGLLFCELAPKFCIINVGVPNVFKLAINSAHLILTNSSF